MQSIGIYPGTFDPIHEGHIALAQASLLACKLDVVYFIPEREPRRKTGVTGFDRRVDICRKVVADTPHLNVITAGSDRFTIPITMPEIEKFLGPADFTLLIGSDVASKLDHWPHINILLARWRVAIGMRISDNTGHVEAVMRRIEERYGILIQRTYIHTDKSDVSSSTLRTPQNKNTT